MSAVLMCESSGGVGSRCKKRKSMNDNAADPVRFARVKKVIGKMRLPSCHSFVLL